VLAPAQKELKKKTDISFEIEELKIGRRVDKVKFLITSAKNMGPTKQLDLFEGNLGDFQSPNAFNNRVKKLALNLGVPLNDEVIKSWEKYGQDKVIEVMEHVQTRNDIDNPVGYITTVLKASQAEQEVAATSESQSTLMHLISHLRRSKEPKQGWFVRDLAIEELQANFNMDFNEASSKFDELKKDLFESLGVEESASQISEEELQEKRQRFEAFLKSRKK
jgi:plasmid replication initiation protein